MASSAIYEKRQKWKKNQIDHAAGHVNLHLLLRWWTEDWLRVRNKVPNHQVNAYWSPDVILYIIYLRSKYSSKPNSSRYFLNFVFNIWNHSRKFRSWIFLNCAMQNIVQNWTTNRCLRAHKTDVFVYVTCNWHSKETKHIHSKQTYKRL